MKVNSSQRIFQILNAAFMAMVCIIILIPIWMVILTSLSPDYAVADRGFILIPKGIDFSAYIKVITTGGYLRSFIVSIMTTVAATAVSWA